MFQQIYSIARNTYVESIRQPIFSVVTLVALLVLALSPAIASYTMDDDNKILVDMGLSTVFLAGLALAAFTAAGVVTNEIDNKTVLTVISKPVSRTIFILGKYAGVAAAIATSFITISCMLLLTMRHKVMQTASDPFDGPVIVAIVLAILGASGIATFGNYFYRWVFTSTLIRCLAVAFAIAFVLVLFIGKGWIVQPPSTDFLKEKEGAFENGQIFVGLLMLAFALSMVIAVAVAVATRFKQAITLIICFGVFVLGLINDFILGNRRGSSALVEFFYGVIPNFQFLWPADLVTQGYTYSANYIYLTAAYTVAMVATFLSLAVILFQTREVG